MQVWEMVKGGHRLDLDTDGYVPDEKMKEWEDAYASMAWRRGGLEAGSAKPVRQWNERN